MNFTMQFATPVSAEMRASGGQGAGPGQVSGLQAGHGGLWLGLEGRFMPAFYRTKGFTRRGAGHTGKAPAVTSFVTGGQDTVNVMSAPGAEALTGHRECTLGTETVNAIVGTQLSPRFLAPASVTPNGMDRRSRLAGSLNRAA